MKYFYWCCLLQRLWRVKAALLVGIMGMSFSVQSLDIKQIDRLTEQWLNIDRQTSHLHLDWQTQQPILQQRILLLKAEKIQLEAMLLDNQESENEVTQHRKALFAEQESLEHEQQITETALENLLQHLQSIQPRLPPPLIQSWQDEFHQLGDNPSLSLQLQVALAQLSRLADFNSRISIHAAPIVQDDGHEILVKQLYLGLGMAWFVNADSQYAGWGQATDNGWQWQLDESINTVEITRAIAIFEKRQQADFVRLPLTLTSINQVKGNSL